MNLQPPRPSHRLSTASASVRTAAWRGWLALVLVGTLFGSLASCEGEVVYSSLQLAIRADALDGGARISRVVFEFRKVEGTSVVPLTTEPADQRYEFTVPGTVDLSQSEFKLDLLPGDTVKGRVLASAFGLVAGDDRPKAIWVGQIDLDARTAIPVYLKKLSADCDADGDGVKNCSKAGCCQGDETLVSDCNDDGTSGVVSSPLQPLPKCVPCAPDGAAVDYDCDGTVDVCSDADKDGVADCDEAACGSEGDGTVFPGATETCDGKDNDCDGTTDEGSTDLDGDGIKDCVDDDRDGDEDPNDEDCAPDDDDIHHGATEICNQVDDDCDEDIDEGLPNCGTWDGDWDGDGYLASKGEDCNEYDSRVFDGSTYAGCCDPALKGSLTDGELAARCDFDCDGTPTLCSAGDKDFDGFDDSSSKDCPPVGPDVYKGAAEKCGDGIDQDCSLGDVACEAGTDADGDKYFAGPDCDDGDPAIRPGAVEVCNGKDDDCNGFVDDGNPGGGDACDHPARATGVCILPENKGTTVCAHGLLTETAPALAKQQAGDKDIAVICVDFIEPPAAESACDDLDEDCDGLTDEDFEWIEKHPDAGGGAISLGKGDTCGTGECAGGTVICDPVDATKLACTGLDAVSPETEGGGATVSFCDGKDNDCDGVVDGHTLPLAMTTCKQLGVCGASATSVVTTCSAGEWQCDYDALADYDGAAEARCDGKDNDCDGNVDEDLTWSGILFGTECDGTGQCGKGKVECSSTPGSTAATCSTNPDGSDHVAVAEVCDAQDNDCDGVADDGLTWTQENGVAVPLGGDCNGVGECGPGKVQCSSSANPVTTCSSNPDGMTPDDNGEVCDGKDNDCDGQVDDGIKFQGTLALGAACVGVGTCGAGVVVCSTDLTNPTCSTNPDGSTPKDVDEVCDGLDNDCDGEVDEGLTYLDPVSGAVALGEDCEGIGECGDGIVVCSELTKKATCSSNSDGSVPESSKEVCDGKDNDCDGVSDDGIVWVSPVTGLGAALGSPCQGVGKCGNGTAGVVQCSTTGSGLATCSTNPDGTEPRNDPAEKCNNIDDDCNGTVDDVLGTNAPDVTCKLVGVCTKANVVATCVSAAWQCNYAGVTDYEADTEFQCDGKDNDCDGQTDEATSIVPTVVCDADGVCQGLQPTCLGPNGWECLEETLPGYAAVEEDGALCDGKDNDCDGQTDEKYPGKGDACSAGVSNDCKNTGTRICDPISKNALVCSVTGKPVGTTCNDNNACTKADLCSGGDASLCVGTVYSCTPDGLTCTADTCNGDGTCRYDLNPNTCLIGGVCYAKDQKDPQNDCRICNPTASTSAWTNVAANVMCNDGNGCTNNDKCNGSGLCQGSGKDCSDLLECTLDECSNSICSNVNLKPDTCLIAGACYAKGQQNPLNECQVCEPATSKTVWSNRTNGTVCTDGNKCTLNDACLTGTCVGAANPCDDGEVCTTDSCSNNNATADGCANIPNSLTCADDGLTCTNDTCSAGVCTHPTKSNVCNIGGICYAANAPNPDNVCQKCDTTKNQGIWTNLANATACNDGEPCTTGEVCNGGACKNGTPTVCDDSNECTLDICIPGTGCNFLATTGSCTDDGKACTIDQCVNKVCKHDTIAVGTCLIGGVCRLNGDADPTNACKECNPNLSNTAFSNRSNGSSCNADGSGCTQSDSCQNGTCTAGPLADCSASTDECNTGVCISASATSYNCGKSAKSNGTPCAVDGFSCTVDQCVGGKCDHATISPGNCLIGTTCVAENALDPSNDCKACRTATSQSAYSNRDNGSVCTGDGLACTTSTCTTGTCGNVQQAGTCIISGACYNNGAVNPSNKCLVCNTSLSTTQWSNAAQGASCDSDGLACTDYRCDGNSNCQLNVVDGSCYVDGACKTTSDRDPANDCRGCVPATSKTAWSNMPAATACQKDGVVCSADTCNGTGTCVVDATKCVIGGVCYAAGAVNPANECQVCNLATPTVWTNKMNGTACTADSNACTLDQCNAGVCAHPAVTGGTLCDDGNACTSGDVCTGTACGGTPYTCPSCRTCDGSGACTTKVDKCFISDTCYDANAQKPLETCSACIPAVSTSAWSPRGAGATCYDFATGSGVGQCVTGTCDAGNVCGGDVGPGIEATGTAGTCTDNIDNDCDGLKDAADVAGCGGG